MTTAFAPPAWITGRPRGDVEVCVGGTGATFVPELRLTRWSEVWLSVRLLHDVPGTVDEADGVTIWRAGTLEAHFYPLYEDEGGYEFGVSVAPEHPTNVLEFRIAHEGVEFLPQPAMRNACANGDMWEPSPLGGIRMGPAKAAESIALYAPGRNGDWSAFPNGKNYKAGKVGHIWRPWAVDEAGERVWCRQVLDGDTLRITIPEDFRQRAVGRIFVDPTFGYDTQGALDDDPGNNFIWSLSVAGSGSSPATPASDGTLTSVTIYGRNKAGTAEFDPALYSNLVTLPNARIAAVDTGGSSFTGSNSLVSTSISASITTGTQYWFGHKCGNTNGTTPDYFWRYDVGGATELQFKAAGGTPPPMTAWQATAGTPDGAAAERVTIYGTYTASGTTIAVPAGSLVETGRAPTVTVTGTDVAIAMPAGAEGFTGQAPTVVVATPNVTIAVPAGAEVWQGYAPTVSLAGVTIAMPAGSMSWTGYQPGVGFLGPGAGQLVWQGLAPTVFAGQLVTPSAGSEVWQGYAPVSVVAQTLTPGAGQLVWLGYEPTVLAGQSPSMGAGAEVWQGYAPAVFEESMRLMGAGALGWTGYGPVAQVLGPFQPGAGSEVFQGYRPFVRNSGHPSTGGDASSGRYRYDYRYPR